MTDTYSKEVYHWRKEHGICTRCGQYEATVGTRCAVCSAEQAEYRKRQYDSMSEDEKRAYLDRKNKKRNALRQERKEKGLCVRCGKPVYKDSLFCYEHHLYQKRKHKEYNDKKRKSYAEIGKCRICGKDTVEGKKFCEEHLKQYREQMSYANSKRKKGNNNGKRNNNC